MCFKRQLYLTTICLSNRMNLILLLNTNLLQMKYKYQKQIQPGGEVQIQLLIQVSKMVLSIQRQHFYLLTPYTFNILQFFVAMCQRCLLLQVVMLAHIIRYMNATMTLSAREVNYSLVSLFCVRKVMTRFTGLDFPKTVHLTLSTTCRLDKWNCMLTGK